MLEKLRGVSISYLDGLITREEFHKHITIIFAESINDSSVDSDLDQLADLLAGER